MLKRTFDLIISVLAICFFMPLIAGISIIIKVTSKGPVFYRGIRIGLRGKPFLIYKFRTMVCNAEKIGSTATAKDDPRITNVGRVIRKYKIDELPQLMNVIKGEMSLVGPRPEVEEHVRCYSSEEKKILSIQPGITDYASIRFINLNELLGYEDANRVFIEKYRNEKNRLRIEYVKNRSFFVDIKIILKTVLNIVVR